MEFLHQSPTNERNNRTTALRHDIFGTEPGEIWFSRKTEMIALISVWHLVVVKPEMMPDLVRDRIAHFLHDFFLRGHSRRIGPP